MSRLRIAVVGDVVLDADIDGAASRLCPDAPVPVVEHGTEHARPGGAGLAAWMLARDGHDVTLVTATGAGECGRRLRALLARCGVAVADLGGDGAGMEKIRVRAGGQVLLRLDRGAPAGVTTVGLDACRAVATADAVLVSDYGLGVCAHPEVRNLVAAAARVVWDPHARGASPPPGVALVTPNAAEAAAIGAAGAAQLRTRLGVAAVAVTRGALGAELADGAGPAVVIAPARHAESGDTLGAGDRFAATAATALARGLDAQAAVQAAVAEASGFVLEGGVGTLGRPGDPSAPAPVPDGTPDALEVVRRTRARGGIVVATGGCFDLLHAGHVASLDAARALGDCLVVLLNSDRSVRRLKGPDRPVVPEEDRARVLRGLRAVDAVMRFDEDDPAAALEVLRPDIFAKGAEYDPDALPEARVMRRLGGRVMPLPFVAGRSTTRLITEVTARART